MNTRCQQFLANTDPSVISIVLFETVNDGFFNIRFFTFA